MQRKGLLWVDLADATTRTEHYGSVSWGLIKLYNEQSLKSGVGR